MESPRGRQPYNHTQRNYRHHVCFHVQAVDKYTVSGKKVTP